LRLASRCVSRASSRPSGRRRDRGPRNVNNNVALLHSPIMLLLVNDIAQAVDQGIDVFKIYGLFLGQNLCRRCIGLQDCCALLQGGKRPATRRANERDVLQRW